MPRRTTRSPYAACAVGEPVRATDGAGHVARVRGDRDREARLRRSWSARSSSRARSDARGRRGPGPAQGRPGRARGRGAHRDRRRPDRARGRPRARSRSGGRPGREVAREVAVHRAGGREAGPAVVVPRGRRRWRRPPRSPRWSRGRDLAVVLHEDATEPLAASTYRRPGGSSWSSARRADCAERRWRPSPTPAPRRPARRRGAAYLDRRRRPPSPPCSPAPPAGADPARTSARRRSLSRGRSSRSHAG